MLAILRVTAVSVACVLRHLPLALHPVCCCSTLRPLCSAAAGFPGLHPRSAAASGASALRPQWRQDQKTKVLRWKQDPRPSLAQANRKQGLRPPSRQVCAATRCPSALGPPPALGGETLARALAALLRALFGVSWILLRFLSVPRLPLAWTSVVPLWAILVPCCPDRASVSRPPCVSRSSTACPLPSQPQEHQGLSLTSGAPFASFPGRHHYHQRDKLNIIQMMQKRLIIKMTKFNII